MPITTLIQNSFTAGELDPKLVSRNDLATYYSGAYKLRNVLAMPQGSVKRRPGLEYLNEHFSSNIKLVEFLYSDSYKYIIIFEPGIATIYKNGFVIETLSIPITFDQLKNITFAQSNDYLLIFHEEFSPNYIVRENDLTWSVGVWELKNIPTHNFSNIQTTTSLRIESESGGNIDFSDWVDGSTFIGAAKAFDNYFSAEDVGKYIRGPLGGYAKIEGYTDPKEVVITILAPFTNELSQGITNMYAGEWTIEEYVFSDEKGFPKCGFFYQGRLWLASTSLMPDGIWASKTNNEEDFGNWVPDFADNGIFLRVRDSRGGFHHINAGKHLTFFSTEGNYFIETPNNEPIVPTNVSIKPVVANMGAKNGLRAFIVSGSTVFVRNGGRSLIEATYSFADGNYVPQDLNLLSSHILNNPIDFAYRKQTDTDESDYLIVINTDGTASVLCVLREQEVIAWTKIKTKGKFKKVVSDGLEIYFIVERSINGSNKYMFERFNDDLLLDSAVINPGKSLTYNSTNLLYAGIKLTYEMETKNSISNMHHLMNETVKLITDNTLRSDQIVTGDILYFPPGVTGNNVQAGLDFPIVEEPDYQVYIESMPIELSLNGSISVGDKKRISKVTAMVYETSHLIINKNKIPIRKLGISHLDTGVPLITDNLIVQGLLGWDDEINISIGQELPLPFTLLGMSYKLRS